MINHSLEWNNPLYISHLLYCFRESEMRMERTHCWLALQRDGSGFSSMPQFPIYVTQ